MLVRQAVSGRSERNRQVLHLRYFEDMSQRHIAAAIGVSQMQVSRILRSILTPLRDDLTDAPPRRRSSRRR